MPQKPVFAPHDTLPFLKKDTVISFDRMAAPKDTLAAAEDTTAALQDTVPKRKSSLEAPVFSTGRDSIDYDLGHPDRLIYYYGDVTVTYGNMELKADYMEYNARTRTVFAKGSLDSLGNPVGNPVMKEGDKTYSMEQMYYNFGSGKAIISNVITQEGDGYLHGATIKKMPDNSINVRGGKYTTCDHEHPHFYLRMSEARVLQSPKQTVFGPSYLVLEDVPLPLILPFGFVPDRPGRAAGLLFPRFTDEVNRGFAIQDLGYYFVMGDYADLALTGTYFTRGSWSARAVSRYVKRYKFNGGFNLDYAENILGEKGSNDYSSNTVYAIRWNHSMDPKMLPGTMFSASVNFSASAYNTYQSQTPQQALQNTASSSISYRKTWEGTPFNLSINATHSQSMRDSSYALGLPNITFTMNRVFPFKIKNRVGKERWFEQFALTYNTTFDNKINFKESQLGREKFTDFMRNGMKHNFGITLPSITLFKHIQVTPSVNFNANMYFQSTQKTHDSTTNRVVSEMSSAFSEFHVATDYSFGLSATTRLYGVFPFGKNAFVRALRHMITPNVGFSFRPYQDAMGTNGYTAYTYTDTTGKTHMLYYNKFEGQMGITPQGRTGSVSFSLNNNLEMKVRSKSDTVTGERKIKLIDNLSISSSYNFFADSINLSNIAVSMNTTLFEKVNINGNMQFDPYAINGRGVKYNKLTTPRLISAGVSFGYSFSGGEKGDTESGAAASGGPVPVHRYDPKTGEYIMTEWHYYADFNAPWSFNFNYGYNYSVSYNYTNGQLIKNHNHNQTLGFSGQLQLTKAMHLGMSSGFDFKELTLTTTSFDMRYDLHCFEFIFNWVPSGRWEQWSFRINAKSGALADLLKYDKRKSFWDR
ncbi:MAG: LPS-assembly protein LptD [Prevotellaceae bacterium]|nr:LPS-assembly protein LptD [Prevotellaceae bacterium]